MKWRHIGILILDGIMVSLAITMIVAVCLIFYLNPGDNKMTPVVANLLIVFMLSGVWMVVLMGPSIHYTREMLYEWDGGAE
jgi:uncharacterized membrane protein